MIKMEMEDIGKEIDSDMIKEVGNILSNNSANAFSQMMKENINVQTDVELISTKNFNMEMIFTNDFTDIFQDVNNNYVEGYFLQTTKGVEGVSVLLFDKEHIKELVNKVAKGMGFQDGDSLGEEQKNEILKEFTNICLNAYLTALGNLIEAKISASTPIPVTDILGSLYDFRKHLEEANTKKALMIQTDILTTDSGITGRLVMLFEPNSLKKIVETLNQKASGG